MKTAGVDVSGHAQSLLRTEEIPYAVGAVALVAFGLVSPLAGLVAGVSVWLIAYIIMTLVDTFMSDD